MKPALRAGTKKFVEVELHSTFLSYVGNILIIVIIVMLLWLEKSFFRLNRTDLVFSLDYQHFKIKNSKG